MTKIAAMHAWSVQYGSPVTWPPHTVKQHNNFLLTCFYLFCTCFCVACVAWQTHRDHVVRPRRRCRRRRWCRRLTFRFRSIIFEGMYWFHSNFAELYITIKYRSSSILVIILPILAELWPFFDLVFVVCFRSITFEGMHWFHSNFAELYITVIYRSSSILAIIR